MAQSQTDPRVSSDNVDLTNCDREAIHLLGRVQSYGALVAVSADWIVQHASENLVEVLGTSARDALGQPLTELLDDDALQLIRRRLRGLETGPVSTRIFALRLHERAFDVSVHQSGRHLIFEFEPSETRPQGDALSRTYPMIQQVRDAASFDNMCQEAARAVQALSGFDSVMVYRFAADHSGEVVAEAKVDAGPSYLGLRFPASDIPKQARALYKRSLLRLIADVADEGSPIVPDHSPEGEPLDLSLAVTRAVSPIHIEYLKNMGVKASMSVSIIKDGELWGMFACHNRTPRYVSFETRTTIELFAHLFSYELVRVTEQARTKAQKRTQDLHSKLLMKMANGTELSQSLKVLSDELENVIDHDGVALISDGNVDAWGMTPSEEELEELARYLNTTDVTQIFATRELGASFSDARNYAQRCAGIMAIPISRTPRDYLIFCRREVLRTVSWAGNPEKPATLGPNGVRLTPRKSFEAWRKTMHGQSAAWTPDDLRTADHLRTLLLEIFLRLSDQTAAERERAHERQELLIAELNHRVRNILNLMRGLVSQSSQDDLSVADFAKSLDARIHSLARAHDQLTRQDWAPVALSELLSHEFAAYLGDQSERVRIAGPDVLLASEAYTGLALVVHEMVTNSVKYGALSGKTGLVDVKLARSASGALTIDWQESGGPAVQPPERRGFGSAIIERSIPFELGGEAEIDYPETGVVARFLIPERHLTDPGSVVSLQSHRAPTESAAPGLSGRALVVEDSMIVAMDASDILSDFGATEVEVAGNVKQALDLLDRESFETVLLDVNLGKEQSIPVAARLAELGIPFVLTTGYSENGRLREDYPDCVIVQKPFSNETIGAALVELGLTRD
jgi:light-regulated signal transduction histidine kinase (bacteriophytochrome)